MNPHVTAHTQSNIVNINHENAQKPDSVLAYTMQARSSAISQGACSVANLIVFCRCQLDTYHTELFEGCFRL
jgi:hypothetical protein